MDGFLCLFKIKMFQRNGLIFMVEVVHVLLDVGGNYLSV
jgi:hypothetical protein